MSDCRFSLTILSCQTRLTSSFLLTTAGDAVISAIIMSKTRPQNHISRPAAKIPKTAALLATVGGSTLQDEQDVERNHIEELATVPEGWSMALDEDLAERMRVALAGAGAIREVKMFGGLCFMLNGNMVAGTSKRGLMVRVGKEQQSNALARPGAKRMEMTGRPMEGYVFVDPPPPDDRSLQEWIALAVAFVKTLPPKLPKSKPRRKSA